MKNLTLSDLVTTALPPLASITLAEINTLFSMASVLLGAAYLSRKWYREEKQTRKKNRRYDSENE